MARKTSYTVSIPKPCHQGWENMTPSEKGRFCEACQKEVIDFTHLRDEEIIQIFRASQGKVCGHVKKSQLGREMYITDYPWQFPFRTDLLAGLLALAAMHPLLVQASPARTELSAMYPKPAEKDGIDVMAIDSDSTRQIRGTVLDSKSGSPLAFVNVHVLGTLQGVTADSNGNFVLLLDPQMPQEITLEFLAVGYLSKEVIVSTEQSQAMQPMLVYLEEHEMLLDGVMIIEPKRDRTGKRVWK